MNIEFKPDIGEKGDGIVFGLSEFFQNTFGSEYINHIDQYLITEEKNYELVVQQINPSSTVSNNDSAIGIAKTIFNAKTQKSSIIIKNCHILPVVLGLNSGLTLDYWTNEQLDALFTSIHEFGHAKDYTNRRQSIIEKPTYPFRLEKASKYYFNIIICEVGANISAKPIVPKEFKLRGRANLIEHVSIAYKELSDFISKEGVRLSEDSCFNLIFYISTVIRYLQEVFIHRISENESLTTSFQGEILEMIEKWIRKLESTYPDLEESENEFENILLRILESLKLKLIRNNNRESIEKCITKAKLKKGNLLNLNWLRKK